MSVDPKVSKTLDAYISQVDSLLNKSYIDGMKEKEELHNQVAYFILTAFPDGKERLTNLLTSFPISAANPNNISTEEGKQAQYTSYLKAMRRKLVTYKEELMVNKEESQVSKEEPQVKMEELPVKLSPEKTTDTPYEIRSEKQEGAVQTTIVQANKQEPVDMRRSELVERDELNREILKIRKDVKDIKAILIGFSIGLAGLIVFAVLFGNLNLG